METVKSNWFPGVGGEGGINRWGTEDLGGSETTLCVTIVVDTCHHTLIQTHKIYNMKNET